MAGRTSIEIGLSAVIVAVDGTTPKIFAVRQPGGDGEDVDGLPLGPFDPLRHRTLEIGLRSFVEEQTGLSLGFVHEGRRRQLQLVGKLMRMVDEAPLREAVAAAKLGSAKETLLLHETERWRDALLADDAALTPFLDAHAGVDAQALRSLVRAARREQAKPEGQRNPRAVRDLFQLLRPLLARSLAGQFPETDDNEHEHE